MTGEIVATLLLVSGALFVYALRVTHIPKSRQVSILLERGEYLPALTKALEGIGMIPWGWLVKPQHSVFVVRWLTINEEMKDLAAKAMNRAEVPPSMADAVQQFLRGVTKAEDIARGALTKQPLSYGEREWNALWLNNCSIKVQALRSIQQ
jgi:hypothetical protein